MRGKRGPEHVILVSDDDDASETAAAAAEEEEEEEEANADLSMSIVAKASRKIHHRKTTLVNCIVIDDNDEEEEKEEEEEEKRKMKEEEDGSYLENGLSASEERATKKARKFKKKKFKRKKKTKVSDDLENKPGDSKVEGDILFKLIADDGEDNLEMRKLLRGPRYFDVPENKTENCTEEARKRACYVCGSLDHDAKDCPQGTCFICKCSGHFARSCPNKQIGTSRVGEGSHICLRCGEDGHEMSVCNRDYHPEDLKVIKCYICKKYGHLCCVDVTLTSERKDSCYNCGELGHTGVGCAKLRSEENRTAAVCYRCGEEGHFARGCRYRSEADFWGTARTPIVGNRQIGDFQGFQSVPAKVGRNSRWSDGKSNEKQINTPLPWLTDRWNMHEHGIGNAILDHGEDYKSSSRRRQRQSSVNYVRHQGYMDHMIDLESLQKNRMKKWRKENRGP